MPVEPISGPFLRSEGHRWNGNGTTLSCSGPVPLRPSRRVQSKRTVSSHLSSVFFTHEGALSLVHTRGHSLTYSHTNTHLHTLAHTFTHTRTHIRTHTHTHTFYVFTRSHAYLHIESHGSSYTFPHVLTHTDSHVFTYAHTSLHVLGFVRLYTHNGQYQTTGTVVKTPTFL